MPISPPYAMTLDVALMWCDLGWSIRCESWKLSSSIPGQVAVVGDEPLKWITGQPQGDPGLYYYRTDTESGVVTNVALTKAHMLRTDWTCLPPDGTSSNEAHTNPNAGLSIGPAGATGGEGGGMPSGGGGAPSGGSGGGMGGSFGGGGAGGAGGGSSSGGGSTEGGPLGASLDLTANRTSGDTCIPLNGDGSPSGAMISDDFTGTVSITDPQNGTWSVTVYAQTELGPEVMLIHPLLVAGAYSADFAFSRLALPGGSFGIRAVAHGFGASARPDLTKTTSVDMRPNCTAPPECPEVIVSMNTGDITTSVGGGASWTASAGTSGGHSIVAFEWYHNDPDVPAASGAVLTLSAVSEGDAGMWTVKVTSDCGSVGEASATLYVETPPE